MSVQTQKAPAHDEGVSQYYIAKIEELESLLREKKRNLRRLEAQRNELNAKGKYLLLEFFYLTLLQSVFFVKSSSCSTSQDLLWERL
mgnify:CR=1 FL=1